MASETKAQAAERERLEAVQAAREAGTLPDAVTQGLEPGPGADVPVEEPSGFRLVPVDWTLHAVEFPYGPDGEYVRIARDAPAVWAGDEADNLVAAAAEAGTPIVKEPVA